jgi:COMPASS component SWD2
VIKEHNKDIVGLDFSNDGTFLYSADSTTLNIFETRQGKMIRKLFMKTHEIEQLSHTHHNHGVLVATKKGHMILYWSIHDNKVIKAFEGHKDTITGLMMCPSDDKFISTSQDNTIRLWDLSSNSKGKYEVK